ncbi:MAG: transcriptional repressor LexA [Caldilineaceae bacterium]|nr:transcriptional repressor LexA [Caldilineaceae bacterium]
MSQHDQALSERQRQIIRFIFERQQEGWTPSVREIGDAVGLRSSAAVQKQLTSLERKGYIRRPPGQARSIQLLKSFSAPTGNVPENLPEKLQIPIVGEVTAGVPILAQENITGYLTVVDEALLTKPGSFFALRVQGESMIEAGILSGDYVVVLQQPTAENGEIVVALLDEEATVKRFFKEPGQVRLQPANASMKPLITRDVQILGRVVSVIRRI